MWLNLNLFLFVIGLAIAFDGMSRLISLQSISSVKGKFFTFSLSQPYYSNVRKSDVIVGQDDLELFHNGCKLIPSSMKVIGSIISISFEDVIEFNSFRLHQKCNKVSIEKIHSTHVLIPSHVPQPYSIPSYYTHMLYSHPYQHPSLHILLSCGEGKASEYTKWGRNYEHLYHIKGMS